MNSTVCGNCEDHTDVGSQFSIGFWHQTPEQTTSSSATSGWPSSHVRAEDSEVGRDLEWMVRKHITHRRHVLIRTRLQSSHGAGERRTGKVSEGKKEILKRVTGACED